MVNKNKMLRIPILLALAGLTSFMLYNNEKRRGRGEAMMISNTDSAPPMLSSEPFPEVQQFDSDSEFSDSDASLNELDLTRN